MTRHVAYAIAALAFSTIASNAAGSWIASSRERLAVELDFGLVEAVDELAVAQAAFAAGRVDADDPQLAELALACAAVAEGERLGPHERFFDAAEQAAAAARVALGFLKEPILLALPCERRWWFALKEPLVKYCAPRPPRR